MMDTSSIEAIMQHFEAIIEKQDVKAVSDAVRERRGGVWDVTVGEISNMLYPQIFYDLPAAHASLDRLGISYDQFANAFDSRVGSKCIRRVADVIIMAWRTDNDE